MAIHSDFRNMWEILRNTFDFRRKNMRNCTSTLLTIHFRRSVMSSKKNFITKIVGNIFGREVKFYVSMMSKSSVNCAKMFTYNNLWCNIHYTVYFLKLILESFAIVNFIQYASFLPWYRVFLKIAWNNLLITKKFLVDEWIWLSMDQNEG